jgi:hypothetical protein
MKHTNIFCGQNTEFYCFKAGRTYRTTGLQRLNDIQPYLSLLYSVHVTQVCASVSMLDISGEEKGCKYLLYGVI